MPITPLHIERGREMRRVIEHDVATRGMMVEDAIVSLAQCLGIQVESVKLAIAIANDADAGGEIIALQAL